MSCKAGDIIVVNNYMSQGRPIGRHSFVVLSTQRGQIQGLDYDLGTTIWFVMSCPRSILPSIGKRNLAILEIWNMMLTRKSFRVGIESPGT